MLDELLAIRFDALHNHGMKSGLSIALTLLDGMPIAQARQFIQERFEQCEDLEIAYDRKLEADVILLHSKVL